MCLCDKKYHKSTHNYYLALDFKIRVRLMGASKIAPSLL